jgi:transposase
MPNGMLPGKEGDPGRSGEDNRRFVEGVLWIVRTGAPWRDLPEYFGKWFSVWKRFRRWARKGVFEKIFETLSGEPDAQETVTADQFPAIRSVSRQAKPAA